MNIQYNDYDVVWSPLPGSQALAICCPCHILLYEGSRGPGKTDAQVMAFRSQVGKGYGRFWRGVIFDREYKNLDDLISKSERWFPEFKDGARFLRSKSDYKWVWPTGEELLFRQFKRESDYWNYHGQEFPFIGWNELTKFANPKAFDLMLSCNRSSFIPAEHAPIDKETGQRIKLPPIPLRIFATTNPLGPGHGWVKKRFILPAKPGEVIHTDTNIYNPRTKKREIVTRTQVRLFGSYRENRYLPPEYIAVLENISDPNRRKAWLEGSWDIVAGGAVDDVWNETIHILPRFKIPKGWKVKRAFDWGSTHPFSVGWYAIANGETVMLPGGRPFCPPRGSLIRFAEWYGAVPDKINGGFFNEGLKMSATQVAQGIIKREMEMLKEGWITTVPVAGPADNQIFAHNEGKSVKGIADKMKDECVTWTTSDKSQGSRKNGLQLVRDMLEAAIIGEGPGLFFTTNCIAAKSTLPTLPRDEDDQDDVDTDAEDHCYDEIRYMVSDATKSYKRVNVEMPL